MLASLSSSLLALGATGPADNGRAVRPPQGWRHCTPPPLLPPCLPPPHPPRPRALTLAAGWRGAGNQWNGAISQEIIEGNMRGLADTSRLIDGKHASLASIGYSDAGIGEQRTAAASLPPAPGAGLTLLCLQMTAG